MNLKASNIEMTVESMTEHAYQLAAAFNVALLLDCATMEGAAAGRLSHPNGEVDFVHAHPIIDETTYAIVLHELGHRIHPNGHLRQDLKMKKPQQGCHPRERHQWINMKLTEETAAWEWAEHHALWWTVAMEQVKRWAFGTYTETKQRTR